MLPLNRDDDARRLFAKKPRMPVWLKVGLTIAMVGWLYIVGQFCLWLWRAF